MGIKDFLKKSGVLICLVRLFRVVYKNINHPIYFFKYIKQAKVFFDLSHGEGNFITNLTPFLLDATENLQIEPHYTYHTAWAARRIREISPNKHVDISSHRMFATLVSAFVPFEYYEFRPAELYLSGLTSKRGDLLELPMESGSIQSMSCMHVVEHLGLGRYGDPIDPLADKKATKELSRVLAKQGNLLFVVPVGSEYIVQFNGQRIYTYDMVIEMFSDLELVEFSLIPDDWKFHKGIIENANPTLAYEQRYGCGCFWFRKP